MGLTIPVYYSADTGATTKNAYVALLNDTIPINMGNPNLVGRTRQNINGMPPWMMQQASSHTSIIISRSPSGSEMSYDASATLVVFASQDARNLKLTQVGTIFVKTAVDLNSNITTALYNAVRVMYPDAVDA